MKLLALETSGAVGSVCLCEDDRLLGERSFDGAKQHGRELVPCVHALFREIGWDPRTGPELAVVSQGPGSFTGLRVAITFVKTLAYATKCDVIGVPSLDVLAQNALLPEAAAIRGDAENIGVAVDARRGRVYCGVYSPLFDAQGAQAGVPAPHQVRRRGDMQLLSPAQFLSRLKRPALMIGDGLAAYGDQFKQDGLVPTPESLWIARASVVAGLGFAAYRRGRRDKALELTPLYLRIPEAEEVRLKKLGKLE